MPKAEKVLEVVTDVPWSVPSEVGVIVDLPPRTLTVNPKIAIPVVLGVVAVGAYAAVKVWKKRKNDKAEAVEEELDGDVADELGVEVGNELNGMSKVRPSKKTDTPAV